METISMDCPPVPVKFDPHLLSTASFRFSADNLSQIAFYIGIRLFKRNFNKFTNSKNKVYLKLSNFMEIYARAKAEEEEAEKSKDRKVNAPFYRPRHSNKDDQRLYEGLEHKIRMSRRQQRKNYKVPKI
jgi:hypothetical protein